MERKNVWTSYGKKELLQIAANCRRVPAKGATSFYEACQSFWFVQQLIQMESSGHSISPGRFDQYMYPYYQKDIEEGRITREQAQELIDCIWVKLNDLNKFMSLQSFSNIKFIETYSYATEIVVDNLLSINKKVVLEKDYNTFIKYNSNEEIFVVRVINDESPIIRKGLSSVGVKENEYSYIVPPKIEKVFVDIIVDEFFNTILSDEISNILIELLKKYQLNMSTIKRYATKRHNWKLVKDTIESLSFNIEEAEFKWY